ncbi:hypothetical protein ECG_01955 [Echinococcus granulosus]|uniref:GYF domain containing protein n=1 Tax=Echinococcus granulosus TaxID=6210 RepID=A0A068WBL4_ECHGR|nr:hypothetical protein ECG_01955 [Echinococcus granulosus]CDS15076.1 GYF domain containing protein [Echinococcus granulosus]
MEPTSIAHRYVYTREQLIEIRLAFISSGGPSRYPIADSVISLDPEKRVLQRKSKPIVDTAVLQAKSSKNTESFYSGGVEIVTCHGSDMTQYSTGWRRTRRTSGSVSQSPLDAPTSQRHNSGSSGGEEGCGGGNGSGGNGGGTVRREFDWSLGCGKWRHRSTSGSERGAHKTVFYASGGRGRGRGGNGSGGSEATEFHREQGGGVFMGSPGTRGRGFMRRPFQHGGQSTRGGRGGGGFKPFNNHGTDHGPTEEDFEPHDEYYKHEHPHHHPYLSHHYTSHQFHKDVGLDDVSQGGEGRWNHQTSTAAAQLPQMSSSQSTEQHGGGTPQPPPSPSSLPQTCQAAVAPTMSESVATALGADLVTKPIKEGFSFMPNFPSRPLVESRVQATPPPPPPLPSIPLQSSQSSSTLWYYRDPSGLVRGPYDDATMAAWFSAGYFPIQIEVRRECDKVFSRITDYIAMLGRFPFVGSSDLPPILEHRAAMLASTGSAAVAPPPLPSIAGMVPQAPPLLPQQMNLLQTPLFQSSVALPSTAASASMPQPPQISAAVVGGQSPLVNPNQEVSSQVSQGAESSFIHYGDTRSTLQASKSIFDLNSLTKATLSEMVRLQRDAQRLCERVSALGMDQNLLAKSFAALSLGAVENTASASTPPNIIDLQQLEAAIHRQQQEENEQLKQLQQQQAAVESVSPPPSSPVKEKENIKVEDDTGKLAKVEPTPEKKQAARKDKTVKVDQPPKTPPKTELPTPMATIAKKKKKKSKAAAVGVDAEKVVEEKETVTIVAGASLERDSDWIVVPSTGATSHTPAPASSTSSQQEQDQQQQPKKSKKKRKPKPTASELQQQAWEQEEQRRRRMNAERIAQAEAEAAAAAAAEVAEAAAASVKISAAARRQQEEAQRLVQQRKAREAAMREAAANLAHLKLPAAARWGAASSSNGGGGAPTSMADIFASQMQEEEFARAKPAPPATFASKLAGGLCGSASSTAPTPVATKSKVFVPVEVPQKALTQSKQVASTPKMAATMSKTNVISIWDLPTDSNAIKAANSKKTKKKKANASTHLLTGPIISLAPKARAELVRWCEGQLSGFPRHNVDIPTLISLLCDIEEAEDVLECIESSFGKSQRVSKFSKAFVEKRANLMGATA